METPRRRVAKRRGQLIASGVGTPAKIQAPSPIEIISSMEAAPDPPSLLPTTASETVDAREDVEAHSVLVPAGVDNEQQEAQEGGEKRKREHEAEEDQAEEARSDTEGQRDGERPPDPHENSSRRSTKHKRGDRLMLLEAAKLEERHKRKAKKLGLSLGLITQPGVEQRRRMTQQQRMDRQAGKMSGITLSLPASFTALQGDAISQAETKKKLRSHVPMLPMSTDKATSQPDLLETNFMTGIMMLDSGDAAKERERLCREHVAQINAKIENILSSVDASLLGSISEFVASSGLRSGGSQQATAGGDDLDALLASLAKPAKLEIPTALLFVGVNVPDHDRMFGQLTHSLRSGGQKVAGLRSKDCKMMLKPIIKSLVSQFIGANPSFSLKGKASMRTLQYWYKTKGWQYTDPVPVPDTSSSLDTQDLAGAVESMDMVSKTDDGSEPPLVVVIEDFEAFDAGILKELISIISYYQADIPFVLVLGLATSADALHRMLPRSVSGRLATRKFTFHSSSESFEEIFKEVVMRNDMGLHFGYKTVEWILNSFYSMHLSIQTLQRELTFATIEHFWGSQLSFLCRSERDEAFFSSVDEYLTPAHLMHIRGTKSVVQERKVLKQLGTKPVPELIQKAKEIKAKRRARDAVIPAAAPQDDQAAGPMDVEETKTSAEPPSLASAENEPTTAVVVGLEPAAEPKTEEMDVEEERQDLDGAIYDSPEVAEWELLEQDEDYLRAKAMTWLDTIRRYHRNLRAMRECAVLLVTLEGRPSDVSRKEVFLQSLPNPTFFQMLSGKVAPQRFGQATLPVRSAFVCNSQLFLSALNSIKSMELGPLMQLFSGFHAIIAAAEDFQPFDLVLDAVEGSEQAQETEPTAAQRAVARSWEQTKHVLLLEIERLTERLRARVDAMATQTSDAEREEATPMTASAAASTPLRRSAAYVPSSPFPGQSSPYTPRTNLRKAASSKRIAAWMESWQGDIEQQLKQDLQTFLIRFFSSQLPAYCVFPLYEIFYYNGTDALHECFNAAPLTTVKGALSQPKAYLGSSKLEWPSEHIDTAIAFELYKGQGKVINLKDWFDAFCERMKPDIFQMVDQSEDEAEPVKRRKSTATAKRKPEDTETDKKNKKNTKGKATANNKASTKKTKKVIALRPDAPAEEQAALLARFLTAVGELQMLGFMCPPPAARRNDVLVKMALGGHTS